MGTSGGAGEGPGVIRIQALRYRSLRYVSQRLGPFQVLVGPNASGKSNFLDVVAFLGDLVRTDLETAILGDERLGIPLRATDARRSDLDAPGWLVRVGRGDGHSARGSVAPEEQLITPCAATRWRSMCHRPHGSSWKRCGSSPRKATSNRPTDRSAPSFPQAGEVSEEHRPSTTAHARTPAGWKKVVSRGRRTRAGDMFQCRDGELEESVPHQGRGVRARSPTCRRTALSGRCLGPGSAAWRAEDRPVERGHAATLPTCTPAGISARRLEPPACDPHTGDRLIPNRTSAGSSTSAKRCPTWWG